MLKRLFETKDIKWEDYSAKEKMQIWEVFAMWIGSLGCFGYGVYDVIINSSVELMLVAMVLVLLGDLFWTDVIIKVYKRRSKKEGKEK